MNRTVYNRQCRSVASFWGSVSALLRDWLLSSTWGIGWVVVHWTPCRTFPTRNGPYHRQQRHTRTHCPSRRGFDRPLNTINCTSGHNFWWSNTPRYRLNTSKYVWSIRMRHPNEKQSVIAELSGTLQCHFGKLIVHLKYPEACTVGVECASSWLKHMCFGRCVLPSGWTHLLTK